jgi:NAD(P)-dependent dehydrogenase (short-subunit alcohol dehydrogenase family)
MNALDDITSNYERHMLGLDNFSPSELSPAVALVTGGGRGVGRMIARSLAGAGAAVGILSRSRDELAETLALIDDAGGVVAAATADVTDVASVATAIAKLRDDLGPVDILVNNAGVLGPIGPLWEVDAGEWWRTMQVNVFGMLLVSQLVLPEMVARRRGRVLNIASQAGVHRWPLVSAYSVSKAAVAKLTENAAREASRFGVTMFSVHPGLLPIGLSETGLPDPSTLNEYERTVHDWVFGQFARGRGAKPAAAMELIVRLARGDGDALWGRHISVHDDLDAMVAHIDVVRDDDLYVLKPSRLEPTPALAQGKCA